jgi:hypothetical protein
VEADPHTHLCAQSEGSVGDRRFRLAVAGLFGALLLGAGAGPALASDGADPLSPPSVVPEVPVVISDGALEQLETAPAVDLEPAVDELAQSDGSGGAEAAETALESLISPASESDITTVTGSTPTIEGTEAERATEAPADTPALDTPAAVEPQLQSGIDALRDLDATLEDPGPAGERPAPDPSTPRSQDPDAPQYHDDDFQYQDSSISGSNSWMWEWYLEMDCNGVVSSISNEIGDSSSSVWAWNWTWNWTCGLDGGSEAAAEAFRVAGVPERQAGASAEGSDAAQESDAVQESDAAWSWAWAFSFCGYETTISTQTNVDPGLRWTWNWTWAWACTEQPPRSSAGGDGAPETGGMDAAEALPWIDELVGLEEEMDGIFDLEAPRTVLAGIATAFAGDAAPRTPLGGEGMHPVSTGRAAPGDRPRAALTPLSTVPTPTFERPALGRPSAKSARPQASRRPHAAQRTRVPSPPLDPPPRRAASTPSPGASAASGTGGGSAALTGLVILAAPGLGRLIRETRELSPRDPVRSRLERPG